jgi:carbon monoxide dehydrogenase subunit G
MQLENSFQVNAPPDRVFAYLLDINKVVGCVPGAELSEVVDPSTFKGKVKVKVGPITVAYSGTARISERNDADRTATLTAEGRETTGPGSARATAQMFVVAADGASTVRIVTEYHIAGRVAQFGRGVMEDVSRRLVNEMATCIKANVETANPPPQASPTAGSPQGGGVQPAAPSPAAPAAAVATARPVNALSLMFAVIWDRIRGVFGGRSA